MCLNPPLFPTVVLGTHTHTPLDEWENKPEGCACRWRGNQDWFPGREFLSSPSAPKTVVVTASTRCCSKTLATMELKKDAIIAEPHEEKRYISRLLGRKANTVPLEVYSSANKEGMKKPNSHQFENRGRKTSVDSKRKQNHNAERKK